MKLLKISFALIAFSVSVNLYCGIHSNHKINFSAKIIEITQKSLIVSNGSEKFYIPKKFLDKRSIEYSDKKRILEMEIYPFELEALILVNRTYLKDGGSGGTGGGR